MPTHRGTQAPRILRLISVPQCLGVSQSLLSRREQRDRLLGFAHDRLDDLRSAGKVGNQSDALAGPERKVLWITRGGSGAIDVVSGAGLQQGWKHRRARCFVLARE